MAERDRLTAEAAAAEAAFDAAGEKIGQARNEQDALGSLIAATTKLAGDMPNAAAIEAASVNLARLAQQHRGYNIRIELQTEIQFEAADRSLECEERIAEIDRRLEAGILTGEDLAEEQARQAVTLAEEQTRQTAADETERVLALEAESDRLIREAYDSELVDVEPAQLLPGATGNHWRNDSGFVVAVPRRDLARLETERQRYIDDVAAREAKAAAEEAERASRRKAHQEAYEKRRTKFYLPEKLSPGEWARRSGLNI